jgi:threonine dehydrogenase-like Zn-dependent dehydrogenase
MRAIRVIDSQPNLVDVARPGDLANHVRVKVVSTSICGSDLHLITAGFAEGNILGHEFAGTTPDGTAVAIEPTIGCGSCVWCTDGSRHHCHDGFRSFGVSEDGGMAEEVMVPTTCLVKLPSGLEVSQACLVEPLAVAVRSVNRAHIDSDDTVLVIGAGPIGLAVVAVLTSRGISCDISARHEHQAEAATALGARVVGADDLTRRYSVVVEAAATPDSLSTALQMIQPMGRLALVGSPWEPLPLDMRVCMGEITVIPSMTYGGTGANREFDDAARILAASPSVADTLVTHRLPLDAAAEGFTLASQRREGAIKVVFDL